MKITPYIWALSLSVFLASVSGQTAITSITTNTTDSANTVSDTPGVTFENTRVALTSFVAGGSPYLVSTLADQAFVRRATGIDNPNQSSVWYRDGVVAGNELGTYATDYPSLMLDNNIAGGSDNTFANGTTGAHQVQDGNIERIDFVYSGGLTASSSLVFAVFERGAVGVHDLFRIAAITGWNTTTNTPTAYGALVGPSSSADWGTANVVGDFGYHLFRYDTGDNLTTSTTHTEVGTQGMGGILFTMSQLGITPGTRIYGYSLFGNDVTNGGNSANLIDYTNATYFPVNTTNATGSGGLDLATINGISFSVVPAASTYALTGSAIMALAAVSHWHRRRRNAPAAARTVEAHLT